MLVSSIYGGWLLVGPSCSSEARCDAQTFIKPSMKNFKPVVFALFFGGLACQAQPANQNDQIEQLKAQLRQMQDNFERVQREQREQINALTKKLDELTRAPGQTTAPTGAPKSAEQKQLEEQ